jgi:hypothetical protein
VHSPPGNPPDSEPQHGPHPDYPGGVFIFVISFSLPARQGGQTASSFAHRYSGLTENHIETARSSRMGRFFYVRLLFGGHKKRDHPTLLPDQKTLLSVAELVP